MTEFVTPNFNVAPLIFFVVEPGVVGGMVPYGGTTIPVLLIIHSVLPCHRLLLSRNPHRPPNHLPSLRPHYPLTSCVSLNKSCRRAINKAPSFYNCRQGPWPYSRNVPCYKLAYRVSCTTLLSGNSSRTEIDSLAWLYLPYMWPTNEPHHSTVNPTPCRPLRPRPLAKNITPVS